MSHRMERSSRVPRLGIALVALLVLAGGASFALLRDDGPGERAPRAPIEDPLGDDGPTAAKVDPPPGACKLPAKILERVWRGFVPGRSSDIVMVENPPNQLSGTRHSTPFGYTQNVPIVLWGPGYIREGVQVGRATTVADLAPTFAELLDLDTFDAPDGKVLSEALLPEDERNGRPKIIFTMVWDGGGDNALAQWPHSWPNLKRMMAEGAHYTGATSGSSPSITPAIMATMGTGAFPKNHGIPDSLIRVNGKVVDPWGDGDPSNLEVPALADVWDLENDNVPLVGMMGHGGWHLGMIGHGSAMEGADKDIAVLDTIGEVAFEEDLDYYFLPEYVDATEGIDEAIREIDMRDGRLDRLWRNHPLVPEAIGIRDSPVWPIVQSEHIIRIMEREGFGRDDVADMFWTTYKTPDRAGHFWNMVEPEVRDAIFETDRQVPVLIEMLDRLAGRGNYVFAMTADHGMTPYPHVRGGWSVRTNELTDDIQEEFDHTFNKTGIIKANRGYGLMLNEEEMALNGVTRRDLIDYISTYTIRENAGDSGAVPSHFRDRAEELVYWFAMTPEELESSVACARKDEG